MELAPREILRWHVQRPLLQVAARPHGQTERVAHAEIPMVEPGWLCYSGGVGEDIAIEQHLADRGLRVWLFDPTPRAIAYMETVSDPRLSFAPVGLWDSETTLRFAAPSNPAHVSHTVMRDGPGFDAPCRTLPTIMRENGHERIDVLKLNIEGAEHVVLGHALAHGLRPTVIVLTWEGSGAFRKALRWTRRLNGLGYELVGRNGWWFTYMAP
jgi:FkbM family methyltransferase